MRSGVLSQWLSEVDVAHHPSERPPKCTAFRAALWILGSGLVVASCGGRGWVRIIDASAASVSSTDVDVVLDICGVPASAAAATVVESPTEVRVRTSIRHSGGAEASCASIQRLSLRAPIGNRVLIDDRTGRRAEVRFLTAVDLTAETHGVLTFDASARCYFLVSPEGAVRSNVVWPDDTTQRFDGTGIHARGTWIPVGSVVSGGGGAFPSHPVPHFDNRIPCDVGASETWIFNADEALSSAPPRT